MSNLLVILSDEHQSRAMGCAGHPFVQTPNLDRLAARGTRFTNAYTPSPICVPARASFATGLYVHQHKTSGNDPAKLPAPPKTAAGKGKGKAGKGNRSTGGQSRSGASFGGKGNPK